MSLADVLPTVNATLNGASALWIVLGYRSIKQKNVALHRFSMQAAFVTSTIFLGCYLTRVYLTGTHRYPGSGAMRAFYLGILLTHTILAVGAARPTFPVFGAKSAIYRAPTHREIFASRMAVCIRYGRRRVLDAVPIGVKDESVARKKPRQPHSLSKDKKQGPSDVLLHGTHLPRRQGS
jgi:putative membrane protein